MTARILSVGRGGARLLAALLLATLMSCGTSETDDAPTNTFPCGSPQPLLIDGIDTGYEQCADGTLRRRQAVECPSLLPREGETCSPSASGGECSNDTECPENARCVERDGCYCRPGCRTDADCPDSYDRPLPEAQICLCGELIGECVPAACTSNADCEGLDCRSFGSRPHCERGFACQKDIDACGTNADCRGEDEACVVLADGTRGCHEPACADVD